MVKIPEYRKAPSITGIGWVAVQKFDGDKYTHLTSFRSEKEADEFIKEMEEGHMTTEKLFNVVAESSLFRTDGPEIDILDTLQALCEAINAEIVTDWEIGASGEFALDSLIIGAFWALTECHAGQYSESYATLCALESIFSPGMSSGPEDDSSEKYVYQTLTDFLTSTKK